MTSQVAVGTSQAQHCRPAGLVHTRAVMLIGAALAMTMANVAHAQVEVASITQITNTTGDSVFVGSEITRDGAAIVYFDVSGGVYAADSDGTESREILAPGRFWISAAHFGGTRLAFLGCEQPCDRVSNVFIMNADGTGLRQLTFDADYLGRYVFVRISGDGTKLLVCKEVGFWPTQWLLMSDKGDVIRTLWTQGEGDYHLQADGNMSLNDDGSRLAVFYTLAARLKIGFMETDTSVVHEIVDLGSTADPHTWVFSFSGDGETLVFGSSPAYNGLFSIRANRSDLVQLETGLSVSPHVTSNGEWTVYARPLVETYPAHHYEVFLAKNDGTIRIQLTDTSAGVEWHWPFRPRISGNGAAVTFTTTQDLVPGLNADGSSEVFVVSLSGTSAASPEIREIYPASGPVAGGTQVTILGSDFSPGVSVTFGGVSAVETRFHSDSELRAITPPHVEGTVDVAVLNPDGGSDIRLNGYSYTSVTPAPAPDLLVDHTVSPDPILAGGPMDIRVAVRNVADAGAATNVTLLVRWQWPASVDYVPFSDLSVHASQGLCHLLHSGVQCSLGTTAPQAAVLVTVKFGRVYGACREDAGVIETRDPILCSGSANPGGAATAWTCNEALVIESIVSASETDQNLSDNYSKSDVKLRVTDRDGDSLPDYWEDQGGIDLDGNGSPDIPLSGASSAQKDVFVYYDWYENTGSNPHSHEPTHEELERVRRAFAAAPSHSPPNPDFVRACRLNPNGQDGIRLHFIKGSGLSEAGDEAIEVNACQSASDSVVYADIYAAKERGDFPSDGAAAYRYALFAHYLTVISRLKDECKRSGCTGVANGHGDLVVNSLAHRLGPVPVSGTLMHELGHELGLHHGGIKVDAAGRRIDIEVSPEYKVNHLSVMNYSFSTRGLIRRRSSVGGYPIYIQSVENLDYSRFESAALPTLLETALDESVGVDGRDPVLRDYGSVYYCGKVPVLDHWPSFRINGLTRHSVNWDCGLFPWDPIVTQADINRSGDSHDLIGTVEEWSRLKYDLGSIGRLGFGPMAIPDVDSRYLEFEQTLEELHAQGPLLEIEIEVDVKPGSAVNSINLSSEGTVPVALIATATFDPLTVDVSSLRFGANGNEGSLARCNTEGEDVNTDGRLDLVCHFHVSRMELSVGDKVGTLHGRTLNGATSVTGVDSVRIVPK